MIRHLTIAATAAIATAAGSASATEFVFYAHLSGANEVPGNLSPAIGFMAGVYDDVANSFDFNWNITNNLIGTPTSAHIHNAPAGSNGPVVFGFASSGWGLTGSATWTGLSQAHIDALFDNDLYINFHTTAFPGGEIRGQIVPAPGALALAGVGLAFTVRRRRA